MLNYVKLTASFFLFLLLLLSPIFYQILLFNVILLTYILRSNTRLSHFLKPRCTSPQPINPFHSVPFSFFYWSHKPSLFFTVFLSFFFLSFFPAPNDNHQSPKPILNVSPLCACPLPLRLSIHTPTRLPLPFFSSSMLDQPLLGKQRNSSAPYNSTVI